MQLTKNLFFYYLVSFLLLIPLTRLAPLTAQETTEAEAGRGAALALTAPLTDALYSPISVPEPSGSLPRHIQQLMDWEFDFNPVQNDFASNSKQRYGIPKEYPVEYFLIPLRLLSATFLPTSDYDLLNAVLVEKDKEYYVRWMINPEDTKFKKELSSFLLGHGINAQIEKCGTGRLSASRTCLYSDAEIDGGQNFFYKGSTNRTGGLWSDTKKVNGNQVRKALLSTEITQRVKKRFVLDHLITLEEPIGLLMDGDDDVIAEAGVTSAGGFSDSAPSSTTLTPFTPFTTTTGIGTVIGTGIGTGPGTGPGPGGPTFTSSKPDFYGLTKPWNQSKILGLGIVNQGLIFRSLGKYAIIEYFLLPGFTALHSTEGARIAALNTKDPDHLNPELYWRKHYAIPLGAATAEFIASHGIMPTNPHSQQYLIELDSDFIPTGKIVFRDFNDGKLLEQFFHDKRPETLELRKKWLDKYIDDEFSVLFGIFHSNELPSWIKEGNIAAWRNDFFRSFFAKFRQITGIHAMPYSDCLTTEEDPTNYYLKYFTESDLKKTRWKKWLAASECFRGYEKTSRGLDCRDVLDCIKENNHFTRSGDSCRAILKKLIR